MCTSNAAAIQSGITLFFVSWILEHAILSVVVLERHESWTVARCFTSHISNFSKCTIQKHCELETLVFSRQDWVMARQDRVIHCQAANKSNLFDDVRYLPWSQSWCTHFVANHCCASVDLRHVIRPKDVVDTHSLLADTRKHLLFISSLLFQLASFAV